MFFLGVIIQDHLWQLVNPLFWLQLSLGLVSSLQT